MKPRIFINMHYMALGGAERALLGLLNALDPERVDVDLFLNQHTGEFMPLIPKKINLLPEVKEYKALETHIRESFREGCFGVAAARIIAKLQKRIYFFLHKNEKDDDGYFTSRLAVHFVPGINPNVNYDLAISFLTPHVNCLKKVSAKKKIAWIHTDYSTLRLATKLVEPYWKGYDYIVSISKDVTKKFVSLFPNLSDKIIEIENILSPEFVRQQADLLDVSLEMPRQSLNSKCLIILSVGRFCHQKNFDNVPDIARRIVEAGYRDLRWYLIGFGSDEGLIRDKIAEAGMQDHVIILGKKDNPYPYIKACDLYVQPSRYEGKSVTVREAQMLYKPVVITDYPTAKSQINNGIDGIIIPMDNQACAEGIIKVIQNTELQNQIIEYLKSHDYGNESEVDKVYKLLDE